MRVLELYSGIGGMHYSFQGSTLNYEVAAAIDVNNIAMSVYKHNFPNTCTWNRVIESLTPDEIKVLNCDIWSMSPPCQPFTRLGKQMAEADNRSASFFHVLHLIESIKPKAIILENVKGFELSDPWHKLIDVLDRCGYEYRQFLLTPIQFGIPNCRLRFYLVAHLKSSHFGFSYECSSNGTDGKRRNPDSICTTIPSNFPPVPGCTCPVCCGEINHDTPTDENYQAYLPFCKPIKQFLLDQERENETKKLQFVDDACLRRYFYIFDIVRPCDKKTRCFTKGYSKRIEGTGSLLQTGDESTTLDDIIRYREYHKDDEDALLKHAQDLKLRFFHSREVANLLCFPSSFDFPDHLSEKQRLRLLGNSVNVSVISHLIYWSFGSHKLTPEHSTS